MAWLHSIPRLSSKYGLPVTALQPGDVRGFPRKRIQSHFPVLVPSESRVRRGASHLPLDSGFARGPGLLGRSCRPRWMNHVAFQRGCTGLAYNLRCREEDKNCHHKQFLVLYRLVSWALYTMRRTLPFCRWEIHPNHATAVPYERKIWKICLLYIFYETSDGSIQLVTSCSEETKPSCHRLLNISVMNTLYQLVVEL